MSTTVGRVPAAPTKIPLRTKLAYGIGDMGFSAVVTVTGFFLTPFLLDVVGLRPATVGVVFLLANIWDAITDPAMGVLIDRTQTRWGAKRVYLLFGAIPFGVAYFLNWVVPDLGPTGLVVYYVAVALLLKTAFTIVGIPYSSLTAAMTRDYDERTHLNTYRFTLNLVGSILAVVSYPLLVGLAGDDIIRGNLISAAVLGTFIAVTTLIAFSGTFELPESRTTRAEFNVFGELWSAFSSVPFRYITGIYVCGALTLMVVQSNLLLFVRYWLGAEELFVLIILVFQVTVIVFLGVWNAVAQYLDKRVIYVIAAVIWMIGLLGLFLGPRDAVAPYYPLAFLTGVGAAAVAYLIPYSMLPDVIDEDEVQRGERREGIFYSMFFFIQTLALSLGLALSNFALEAAGYVNPDEVGVAVVQPESVLFTLRVLVGLAPAIVLLFSLPLIYYYPITRERYAEIRVQLAARHAEAAAETAAAGAWER